MNVHPVPGHGLAAPGGHWFLSIPELRGPRGYRTPIRVKSRLAPQHYAGTDMDSTCYIACPKANLATGAKSCKVAQISLISTQ